MMPKEIRGLNVGLEVAGIDDFDAMEETVAETLTAMKQVAQEIARGALSHQDWVEASRRSAPRQCLERHWRLAI